MAQIFTEKRTDHGSSSRKLVILSVVIAAAVIVWWLGALFLLFQFCCNLKGLQAIHVRPYESCYIDQDWVV